jgi:hypothetical protein
MSDTLECNWCSLKRMHETAAARGVRVIVGPAPELDGWIVARYSDEFEPAAFFMEVPEGCAC